MHELSVCRSLLEKVCAISSEYGARKIRSITLRVGPLSGVEPELLRTAFPLVSADGPAAEAELIIESSPLSIQCRVCNQCCDTTPNRLRCPHCGAMDTVLISGDELLLINIVFSNALKESEHV